MEMDAVSGTNWLGLAPAAVLEDAFFLTDHMPSPTDDSVDLSGLEAGSVRAVPLLLQIGMLSRVPKSRGACRPPNEFARRSLKRLLATSLAVKKRELKLRALATALESRDRVAFAVEATRLLELVPNSLIKAGVPREAPLHAALLGAILASVASSPTVVAEMNFQRGRADVVVNFPQEPAATWIFEVGLGNTAGLLRDKLAQAQAYARGLPESTQVTCCALLISRPKPASVAAGRAGSVFDFAWSQRAGAGADASWTTL